MEHKPDSRPEHVGILALDVYFPHRMVEQAQLERHDNVSAGKYTVGLGQNAMAFLEDQEDVVSMSLTVVHSLMDKYDIQPASIGRLEVGTESSLDRSKSVKSFLMDLFLQSGNTDVQGVDCINACYGGTAALFNAVNWIEGRSWDGRYAIVVAADNAIYTPGPARPSGGCGAVAMLIGPDAPLALEPGFIGTHMDNTFDFYKPSGLFPEVDGKLSVACYLSSVDKCYQRLCRKAGLQKQSSTGEAAAFSLADVDFCVMHAPFAKMVQKGFAQLLVRDCIEERRLSAAAASTSACPLPSQPQACPQNRTDSSQQSARPSLERLKAILDQREGKSDVLDKDLQQAAVAASAADFEQKALPGMLLGKECGNMYAASVYASLASLIETKRSALEEAHILISSFGSGLASSIFSVRGRHTAGCFSIVNIAAKLDLQTRLSARQKASAKEFNRALARQEDVYGKSGYKPEYSAEELADGTYYLLEVDSQFRRRYLRKTS